MEMLVFTRGPIAVSPFAGLPRLAIFMSQGYGGIQRESTGELRRSSLAFEPRLDGAPLEDDPATGFHVVDVTLEHSGAHHVADRLRRVRDALREVGDAQVLFGRNVHNVGERRHGGGRVLRLQWRFPAPGAPPARRRVFPMAPRGSDPA